jgi:hypothetical protein
MLQNVEKDFEKCHFLSFQVCKLKNTKKNFKTTTISDFLPELNQTNQTHLPTHNL